MRVLLTLFLFSITLHALAGSKVWDLQNDELIKKNAFVVISSKVPLDKFKPDLPTTNLLRHSRTGIATYLFTSKDGKFRGEAHCQFSALLLYKENVTNADDACFLINMYENDPKGLNGIGRQVGIY